MTIDFSDEYQLSGAVIDRLEQLITIFKILCGHQHKILILIKDSDIFDIFSREREVARKCRTKFRVWQDM